MKVENVFEKLFVERESSLFRNKSRAGPLLLQRWPRWHVLFFCGIVVGDGLAAATTTIAGNGNVALQWPPSVSVRKLPPTTNSLLATSILVVGQTEGETPNEN